MAQVTGSSPTAGAALALQERRRLRNDARPLPLHETVVPGVVVPGEIDVAENRVPDACHRRRAPGLPVQIEGSAGLPQDLLSTLYHHGMEIDALVRVETERTRAGLEDTRRRHVQALLLAAERAAARRLRAADAALELARSRNANLSERLGQISAEGQAWIGVAKSHEAAVAGLRATLDQLLQSQSPGAAAAEGAAGEGADAEDARSCCFETPVGGDDAAAADDHEAASNKSRAACKACGEGESRVLVLPCRHLCLCPACDAAVDKCPVCAATKNASLHVLLS